MLDLLKKIFSGFMQVHSRSLSIVHEIYYLRIEIQMQSNGNILLASIDGSELNNFPPKSINFSGL